MAARKKGTVFYVTSLLALQPNDKLNKALKAIINNNLVEEEQLKLTISVAIMPSYYNNEEKVMLVKFHSRVLTFLSKLMANLLGN
jgi:hypothetical protein